MSDSSKSKHIPPLPHHALARHVTLLDLMTAIFIPATIASAWPDLPPQGRAGIFAGLIVLSLASMWWAASLAHTFQVNHSARRALLHLYAFLAMASFAVFAPASIFVFIGLIFRLFFNSLAASHASDTLNSRGTDTLIFALIVLLPSALLTASMVFVEIWRRRTAELQAPPEPRKLPKAIARLAQAAPSSSVPPPPTDSKEFTSQPARRKKKRKKKRAKLRRDSSIDNPRAIPTPPPPF